MGAPCTAQHARPACAGVRAPRGCTAGARDAHLSVIDALPPPHTHKHTTCGPLSERARHLRPPKPPPHAPAHATRERRLTFAQAVSARVPTVGCPSRPKGCARARPPCQQAFSCACGPPFLPSPKHAPDGSAAAAPQPNLLHAASRPVACRWWSRTGWGHALAAAAAPVAAARICAPYPRLDRMSAPAHVRPRMCARACARMQAC